MNVDYHNGEVVIQADIPTDAFRLRGLVDAIKRDGYSVHVDMTSGLHVTIPLKKSDPIPEVRTVVVDSPVKYL